MQNKQNPTQRQFVLGEAPTDCFGKKNGGNGEYGRRGEKKWGKMKKKKSEEEMVVEVGET